MEDSIMTLEEFVFDIPLYHKVDASNGYNDIIKDLEQSNEHIKVEGYNPIHKKESTFYLERGLGELCECSTGPYGPGDDFYNTYSTFILKELKVKTIAFKCQRYDDEITILVYHDYDNSILIKVGQYPSVADIHIGQIKQYDKVLEKPALREFTKAIGLAANGVGIGSFVYLRRIFEGLIFDAFNEAKEKGEIDIEQFEKQRMEEKIKSLHMYLPTFIVEHSSIYGILSKGIHELSEDECLEYFDTMRASIEMILDQRVELREKQKKEEEVKKKIDAITAKLKK